MTSKSILVGNDINNVSTNNSWSDLLNELIEFCRIPGVINRIDQKPFPLVYEEIFLRAIQKNGLNEIKLKNFISQKVKWFSPNEIHSSINKMDITNIMTTNYDFTLESIYPLENQGLIKERLYSIFRHYKNDDKKYWHLHGSLNTPASINLGYEHYSGQLQQMRNYVVSGTNYKSKVVPKDPLIKRIISNNIKFDSWIDLFFFSDIHILGLNLDFVEIDLWWLLTYRSRQKYYWKLNLNNNIYYYIPKKYVNKSKYKLDLLEANGVIIRIIEESNKIKYYNQVIDRINNT